MIDTTKRFRLVMVIPDIEAGTGVFCTNLAEGLRRYFRSQYEVRLLLIRPDRLSQAQRSCFDAVDSLGQPVSANWRRFWQTPRQGLSVRCRLRELKPDIVFTVATYANLLVSAVGGVRPIMSEHMNMSLRLREARYAAFMRVMMRRYYPKSVVVCAARGLCDDLEQNFGAQQAAVIPNGLDLIKVRTAAQASPPPLPTTAPFSIFIGRLTPQKDVATLLEAQRVAISLGCRAGLLIVGDGELRTELEERSRDLGISDSVHFLGHQSNPHPILKQARCLVLSSRWEGFAYVPIEAMALGIPPICTDCPSGPAEILGGGQFGILTPVGDVQKLGDAIARLHEDEQLHAALSAAALRRSEDLSLEAMASAYHRLFMAELAANRPDGGR